MTLLLLTLYLLPCGVQDYRARRIANGLTVPGFLAAWPLALGMGGEERLLFTFAIFMGCWFAWQMGGMGGADGKLATLVAAVTPLGLGLGVAWLILGFAGMRLRQGKAHSLPAAVGLYLGVVGAALLQGVGCVGL